MFGMRKPSGTTVVYVGYLFFLLGFVSLGLFVAALAFGSSLAAWAGVALVGTFALAVVAFRAGSRGVANIWAESVTRTEADRYRSTYRGEARARAVR
ncbi:hypothetical protein ASE48_08835 [Mycobacterium sp. Root265]|nr:hypothetical protein [Mycobacterium sp. Root265]KRD08649.1 hypothetical protein ASE48_08835 [Mycobacterium sp. Root265]